MSYKIPKLPLSLDLETKPILKKLSTANRALAELKGVTGIIPNQNILISTLALQEAKDSSEIENIITTHDDLYKSDAFAKKFTSAAAKEVYNYANALRQGFEQVKKTALLTNKHILNMQETLEENSAGFRVQAGTKLKNDITGEIVYTPPQESGQIKALMTNLEEYINLPGKAKIDPLISMAVIHHQFESIHPFYDGNGRTGRIINILYLVKSGLLDSPVLYLSRYINQNKNEYYNLLQKVRDEGAWEEWILYILDGVESTSYQTIRLIQEIKKQMQIYKNKMRNELRKIYSQDLINIIFSHPYTKIEFLMRELHIKSRITSARYLDELTRIGLMKKLKFGRDNYYINIELYKLLKNVHNV